MNAPVEKRHLYIVLDDESRRRAASHARLPVVKSDHVTLAYDASPSSTISDFLAGEHTEGDQLTVRAVAELHDERVQAWLVELNGSPRRQQDGGILHVTVSRSESARSRDANDLLQSGTPLPLCEVLRGTLRWVTG